MPLDNIAQIFPGVFIFKTKPDIPSSIFIIPHVGFLTQSLKLNSLLKFVCVIFGGKWYFKVTQA